MDPSPLEVASADILDYALVRQQLLLLLSSPLRRKWLFAGVFAGVLGAAIVALLVLPKSYTAETRILARQASNVRYLPGEDAPLNWVTNLVLSQSNLESLVEQANLMKTFEQTRSPAGRIKNFVFSRFSGTPDDDDRRASLVDTLENRIEVSVSGEGTVVIAVSWPDPLTAYRLARAAQANFVSSTETSEIAGFTASLAILERHAAAVRLEIDRQVASLRALLARVPQEAPLKARVRAATPAPAVDATLQTLGAALAAKRATIRAQEVARARRIEESEVELARLLEIYQPRHPLVMEAGQRLEALRADPPQLDGLKSEAAALEREIETAGGTIERKSAAGPPALTMPKEALAPNPTGNAEIEAAGSQLRLLVNKYNGLLERIDGVRIDRETRQAAFQQRYTVLHPPQVPLKPDHLKPAPMVAAGIALGLALALFATAAMELANDHIERAWQIERRLGIPVLARLEAP